MAKADVLSMMYSKNMSPLEFKFETLHINPLLSYLSVEDIAALHNIASSIKLSSKLDLKYKMIDDIMKNRGFKKFHCGTNRIVYSYYEDTRFLVKIALDRVGLKDNPLEFKNQMLLKPFCTKVFEVSPCGTVATVERVEPITSREEFYSVGADIYNLLVNCIIGKYVLEDIGTEYFLNWGLRKGFGAVLLDYPYVFKLDGNKLFCNNVNKLTGKICDGIIDYDPGFNYLICNKCGKRYLAKELQDSINSNQIQLVQDTYEENFKIKIKRGDNVILKTESESDYIIRK